MAFDAIQTACVVHYPYLWDRESLSGETEGRKVRPTAVGVRLKRPDGDALILLAITSKEPGPDRLAVEIPEMEKRRAGLDYDLRLWIVLDEYNFDLVGQSFYLELVKPIGRFSSAFFGPLMKRFVAHRQGARVVRRDR